jgi:hypothetical protein
MEARATIKNGDLDPFGPKFFTPRTCCVETADRHWDGVPQPTNEFDDEPFRAARGQAEDDLKHSRVHGAIQPFQA